MLYLLVKEISKEWPDWESLLRCPFFTNMVRRKAPQNANHLTNIKANKLQKQNTSKSKSNNKTLPLPQPQSLYKYKDVFTDMFALSFFPLFVIPTLVSWCL